MTIKTGILLTIGLIIAFTVSARSQDASRLEGWKPYTPSRLEWLGVVLNSGLRVDLTVDSGYSMDFVPIENEDAVLIYVVYLPSGNREIMNASIDTARKVIAINAKSHGWSSWLKVKEQIELRKLK